MLIWIFFLFFFILRLYCSIEIDDGNSKHDDDDVDDDGTATKDSDSKPIDLKDTEFDRPSSSGKLDTILYNIFKCGGIQVENCRE